MFRVDPKQAIVDHVASRRAADAPPVALGEAARRIIAAPVEQTYSGAVIVGVTQALEALLLLLVGVAIHGLYLSEDTFFYFGIVCGGVVFANILFNATGTHRIASYRSLASQVGRVLASWSFVFTVMTVGLFLFKASDMVSRVWVVGWFAAGAVVLVAFRLALRALVLRWTRQGKLKRRTVIVGGGRDAEELIEAIHKGADNDVRLFGLFDDRKDSRSPASVAGVPKLGGVAELIEFARQTPIDLILVSMPLSAEKRVLEMLRQLWVLPVDIRLSAHMSKLRFSPRAYSYLGEVPVFDIADRPISDWNLVFKWLFDKLVALTAIIVLSPVMIATAIAIKLESKGPVIFRQKRHGFNNELIEVYKFRSMYTDMSDVDASRLVTKDDPRVTRVGRFIRKTSIDELPQFFNVLKGDLSVVGPRPHALQAKADNKLYYEAVDGYFARHKVKPGVTGWAQINGWRGETDTVDKIMQRVHHDLYYIENWSILLDLYILFMTPISLLRSENAY